VYIEFIVAEIAQGKDGMSTNGVTFFTLHAAAGETDGTVEVNLLAISV